MRGYQTADEKGHQRRGDTHKLLLLSAAQAEGFLQDAVTPKGNALHLNGGSSLYTDTQTCF